MTADRVRTLLLRGDNLLKSARPERFGRAMEAFEEARKAGEFADPCYHLGCDTRDNADEETAALFGNATGIVLEGLLR